MRWSARQLPPPYNRVILSQGLREDFWEDGISVMRSVTSRLAGCVLVSLLLVACGGKRALDMQTIDFDRQIDLRYVADPSDAPQGRLEQFDVSEWFGATTLDGHVPILMVDRRLDMVVVESTDERAVIEWILPDHLDALFLRIADHNFDPDSCPAGGVPADDGVMALETLDDYPHPIRLIYRAPYNYTNLDITAPQLVTGTRYYVQGCVIDHESSLFTGDATNTVVVEVARALPDLEVRELRTLGRSADALGRPFIRIEDLNAATNPEVRGDGSFGYRVSISLSSSGTDPVATMDGTARLLPGGSAWVIPGSETSDTADDIRIPDDGRLYTVSVTFNNDATGISFPEANHFNNSHSEGLQARPKPLIFGIDQVRVTENCDEISDGDWLLMLTLDFGGRERRLIADSTIDVPDNSTTTPKMSFRLNGTNIASSVRAELGFVDCDYDALSGFVIPFYGPGYSIATVALSCGGEEAYEVGGISDLVGRASATLSGVTLDSFVTRTATATEEDCGPAPFSVDFQLMTREQAVDDGYDLTTTTNIP